jgi:hypothetical protein
MEDFTSIPSGSFSPILNGRKYNDRLPGPNPLGYGAYCNRTVFCEKGYGAQRCGKPDVSCVKIAEDNYSINGGKKRTRRTKRNSKRKRSKKQRKTKRRRR